MYALPAAVLPMGISVIFAAPRRRTCYNCIRFIRIMTEENSLKLRAVTREKKKRPKMAVHGRGVKALPKDGIPGAASRRRLRMA